MNIETAQEHNESLTPGKKLRLAREKLGLTQEYVAQQLCLKQSTVRDIEEDENPLGLASTFINGYIRTYARLVNLSDEEFGFTSILVNSGMEDAAGQRGLRNLAGSSLRGFPLGKTRTTKNRDSWLMRITWLILFVVLSLTILWWWQNHKKDQQDIVDLNIGATNQFVQSTEQGRAIPLNTMNTINTNGVSSDFLLPLELQRQASLFPNQSASLTPEAAAHLRMLANMLTLEFSGRCWIDIQDASNQNLSSGVKRGGEKLELSGKPPYYLKVGAVNAVTITFKGKTVELNKLKRARNGYLILPENFS